MSQDTLTLELLRCIAAAQAHLGAVRQELHDAYGISTKPGLLLARTTPDGRGYRADPNGPDIVIDIWMLATRMQFDLELTAYVELTLNSDGWRLDPYLGLLNEGEDVVWQGERRSGSDMAELGAEVVAAAQATAVALAEHAPKLLRARL